MKEINLKYLDKPTNDNFDDQIKWLVSSLGLFSEKNRSAYYIFKEFLEEFSNEGPVASEKIAKRLNISNQKVNYHIKDLVDMGLVYREKKKIVLRKGSLRRTLEEIKKDIERFFDDLEEVADELDRRLGLF